MAGKSSAASGPASFAEAGRGIVQAIADAMTVPDAAPHMAALQDMQKLAVAMVQHVGAAAATPQPAAPPGAAPGGAPPRAQWVPAVARTSPVSLVLSRPVPRPDRQVRRRFRARPLTTCAA